MGFWSGLKKAIPAIGAAAAIPFTGGASLAWLPGILGAAGAGLGAIGESKAQNRDATLGAQGDFERAMMTREGLETARDRDFYDQTLAREQEGRASGTDAWRKLNSAQRTLSPGAKPQLSSTLIAPRQATDAERTGAEAMSAEVMARLQGGNQMPMPTRRGALGPPSMDMGLTKPGGFESTAGWLAPILAALGQRKPSANTPPITTTKPAYNRAYLPLIEPQYREDFRF